MGKQPKIYQSSLPVFDRPDMPSLYAQATTHAEQARHREKLDRLAAEGGLLIDPVAHEEGGWHVEMVTTDWDEPGLLDKVFEGILQCISIPKGVAVKKARIFTGRGGQVVNILEMVDNQGQPLTEAHCGKVLEVLREVHKTERVVLETIQHLSFTSLIPLVSQYPYLDNGRNEDYTYLELKTPRLSNRFTSILLHFLARSEFRVNIQVAEFSARPEGHYGLYVVDKRGEKLTDSHFSRISLVRALEAMNQMILRFNIHYLEQSWRFRQEKNGGTLFLSRPRPEDFLEEMAALNQLARLKGFEAGMDDLVANRLLDNKGFALLKKFEWFCGEHLGAFRKMVEETPGEEDIRLCREYFELRRGSVRIVGPLFAHLRDMAPARPQFSDPQRLHALARPLAKDGFAVDPQLQLYLLDSQEPRTNPDFRGGVRLSHPLQALDPFLMTARTGAVLREDAMEAVEAALEGWTDSFLREHRESLGRVFLAIVDESIRQGTTAGVLRGMRQVGLLHRYLPGFTHITGLIHVIPDHAYTVDEHTFVAIEALAGLRLLPQTLSKRGKSLMRSDYEKITTSQGLAMFARKYAVEVRMLQRIPEVRNNPSVKPFFHLMTDVRNNSLEYLIDVNMLEHSYATCMTALTEMEKIRAQAEVLMETHNNLPFADRRVLMLAMLLHDMKKPDKNHGPVFAPLVGQTLDAMGIYLDESDVARIGWLVGHHLDLAGLLNRMGQEGDGALARYVEQAEDAHLVRLLVVFTYADRVGVAQDPNKVTHDALILAELLGKIRDGDSYAASPGSKPAAKHPAPEEAMP
ncbi:MAG: hypothetical protein OEW12_03190 [Deltaproteobacteria bacterium]|nr:hypothetical protein [Deltaproteobacteria bacterium]